MNDEKLDRIIKLLEFQSRLLIHLNLLNGMGGAWNIKGKKEELYNILDEIMEQ